MKLFSTKSLKVTHALLYDNGFIFIEQHEQYVQFCKEQIERNNSANDFSCKILLLLISIIYFRPFIRRLDNRIEIASFILVYFLIFNRELVIYYQSCACTDSRKINLIVILYGLFYCFILNG